jgi:basic membrane lipoprotein Med (substrate-binding protein (PBP1-ABC) superfamily)
MRAGIIMILLPFVVLSGCKRNEESDLFIPDFEVYAVLPNQGLGDRSFADVVYEGIETAKNDFSFSVKYIIPESLTEGEKWIAGIPELQGKLDHQILVIIAGSQFVDAINKLSGNFGKSNVLLLGASASESAGLASVSYRSYAASYIGGYISAGLVPGCRATVVEAFDAPFLKDFEAGFGQGVTDAGGTVNSPSFVSTGFDGFAMPDSAYSLTQTLLPGNDLIFALAAGSNFGIVNAARDYGQQRYVIGVDGDQSWMGLSVVTGSVVILYGLEIREYISKFSKGSFASGSFTMTMEDEKVGFLMNKTVLDGITIPESLINRAIEKEKAFLNK